MVEITKFFIALTNELNIDQIYMTCIWDNQFIFQVYSMYIYIIIRVHSAFSLVASCVLLKYTRTDDVN